VIIRCPKTIRECALKSIAWMPREMSRTRIQRMLRLPETGLPGNRPMPAQLTLAFRKDVAQMAENGRRSKLEC
jgi:hypothetical protein